MTAPATASPCQTCGAGPGQPHAWGCCACADHPYAADAYVRNGSGQLAHVATTGCADRNAQLFRMDRWRDHWRNAGLDVEDPAVGVITARDSDGLVVAVARARSTEAEGQPLDLGASDPEWARPRPPGT